MTGAVGLQIQIGIDGAVQDVRVTNALPDGLTEAAIKAVREMKFTPASKNGAPVSSWQKIEVEYMLR